MEKVEAILNSEFLIVEVQKDPARKILGSETLAIPFYQPTATTAVLAAV